LLLQAASIVRYFDREGLGRIIFVWNDSVETPAGFRDQLGDALNGLDHEFKQAPEVGIEQETLGVYGWVTQQAVKLLVSQRVRSSNYLVLDAKNHFVRSTSVNDFIARDGKGIFRTEELSGEAAMRYRYSQGYFGLNPAEVPCRAVRPHTPFLLNKKIVASMLDRIVQLEGVSVGKAFLLREEKLTEFLGYQAFYLSEGGQLSDLYVELHAPARPILWGTLWREPDYFENWMNLAKSIDTKIVGVHWAACINMNDRQKQSLSEFWKDRNLIDTLEEGRKLIDSVALGLPEGELEHARSLVSVPRGRVPPSAAK